MGIADKIETCVADGCVAILQAASEEEAKAIREGIDNETSDYLVKHDILLVILPPDMSLTFLSAEQLADFGLERLVKPDFVKV